MTTTKTVALIVTAVVGLATITGAARFLAASSSVTPPPAGGVQPQYNICLLLDLSDRIDPAQAPLQEQRDRQAIAAVVEQFSDLVRHKLFINSRDVLRVAVAPQKSPYDATLLRVADRLTIDLREIRLAEKRSAFPGLKTGFLAGADELFRAATANPRFEGSDIWSFVRDSLGSYRVAGAPEQPVRNILIILTDGYLTFANQEQRPRSGHRTSYMQVSRFRHQGWEEEFSAGDYGLISDGLHAEGWEVLLLEVTPHKTEDLPIMRRYWEQWFKELGAERCRIERSEDSGKLTKGIIADVLGQPRAQAVTTSFRTR